MVSANVITSFSRGANQDVSGSAEIHHISVHAHAGLDLANQLIR